MKKVLVVLGLVLVVASVASAQSARKFSINVGAGLSLPMGDFGDFANMGFHGDGTLMWPLSPKIEVGPAVSYHHFGTEFDESFGSFLAGGDIKFKLSPADATAKKMMPFLLGGLGMAFSSYGGESSSDIFFSLGAGADMGKWFGKVRFVSISTEGSSSTFIPLTIGLHF